LLKIGIDGVFYLLVEVTIVLYSPVMLWTRAAQFYSTIIGGVGFILEFDSGFFL
jgi:tryptophan-rich sensory protein